MQHFMSVSDDTIPFEKDHASRPSRKSDISHINDVVVIGSGIGGLSCAALLSSCGVGVTILESHDTCGGAAHTWSRKGFHFESGPSLYSGFSMDESPNPLKNIFQVRQKVEKLHVEMATGGKP